MQYDLTYIVPAKYSEEEIPQLQTRVREFLTGLQATVSGEQNLGKRKLAYPIKQIRQGYYLSLIIEAESEAIKNVERELQLNSEILRSLITKRRIVSSEQLAREEALRERIRERRAQKELSEKEVANAKEREKTAKPPAPKLTSEELDEKIEQMLGGKMDT